MSPGLSPNSKRKADSLCPDSDAQPSATHENHTEADLSINTRLISGFQALCQARAQVTGPRTCDRRIPSDLRAGSVSNVPPTPPESRVNPVAHKRG
ncbi:hypothetical protein PoB_001379200 [Plakobranchus ocellatus]|uniref:Uncharacterized protein n=1 Tax=Plakobranchus ocellatus TaxID=259542 RepID=A0AAV3YWC6_9GAST|nr:hypothetical protein PoB_001379200 [Plakobranchus ocellatus]